MCCAVHDVQVFVVTFHDITERVALVQKHQDAVESKRNFLAFICHELRNPLNGMVHWCMGAMLVVFDEVAKCGLYVRMFGCVYPGICGMGELLLDTGLDEEQDEYAHFIHANAKSMLHIVNDVLDFSRVESNKVRRGGLACAVLRLHDSVLCGGALGCLGGCSVLRPAACQELEQAVLHPAGKAR